MQTRVRKLEQDLRRERRPASAPVSKELQLVEQKELTEYQAAAIHQLSYRTESLEVRHSM